MLTTAQQTAKSNIITIKGTWVQQHSISHTLLKSYQYMAANHD